MKFASLTLFALLFCLALANAQLNSFDLSKYKTADYTRRMLTFSGSISGGYEENKKDEDDTHNQSTNIYPNLTLDYSFFKNSRKTQKQTIINFELKPNDHLSSSNWQNKSTGPDKSEFTNNRNNAAFDFNSSNRLYFKRNMFFEINPTGYLSASFDNSETQNTSNSTTTNSKENKRFFEGNLFLPVRFGLGRIENVEDARMAIFMLEDLQKNNQLSKSISDEDILAFATKITQLRNMRHFDSRKRRIYEIQALDSFIRDNGFSSAQDAVYFSGLIDNWGYASNPWRMSGNRFSIGMGPTIGYSLQNNLSVEKTTMFNKGLGISLLGDLEKPISLKWQRSIRIETGYRRNDQNRNREDNKTSKTTENIDHDQVYLNFNWGYGFYPDSRSYHVISLNPTVHKIWSNYENSSNYKTSGVDFNISLWLSGYMYLSERFNINYTFGVRYYDGSSESSSQYYTETTKKNNFATSFNLSCYYSIF